jgi:glutathione S-transferase
LRASLFKVVANPEDGQINWFGTLEVQLDDPDVERVRRAHRNDLENILPFFAAGFFYMFAHPNVTVAIWLFRIAAIARILHTVVYAVWIVPQPARFLTFFVCLAITFYMSIHCMVEFAKFI